LGNDLEHVLGLWLFELGTRVGGLALDYETAVAAKISDAERLENVGR
jgi:hypothetical protein